MSFNKSPRGLSYIRMKALQLAGFGEGAERAAVSRYGADGAMLYKAAAAALTTGDFGTEQSKLYFSDVVDQSVIGQLLGLRRVPFETRFIARTNGQKGFWVSEAKPIPMSKPTLAGAKLEPLKVGAIIATTKEAVFAAGPIAEAGLKSDLDAGVVGALDQTFLDATNAGTADVSPASVTFNAPSTASAGDPVADLKALVAIFSGDLSACYAVTDPETATGLAMAQNSSGSFLFPDAGPRGGAILNIPLIVSRNSPRDTNGGQLALIDPTSIAASLDGLSFDASQNATLVMSDDPASGEVQQVSLFQTNTVAWRVIILANWSSQRAGGVAVLTGTDY